MARSAAVKALGGLADFVCAVINGAGAKARNKKREMA